MKCSLQTTASVLVVFVYKLNFETVPVFTVHCIVSNVVQIVLFHLLDSVFLAVKLLGAREHRLR